MLKQSVSTIQLIILSLLVLTQSVAEEPKPSAWQDTITQHEYTSPAAGTVTSYLTYHPTTTAPTTKPSLLIFLHGAGGSLKNYNYSREPYALLREQLAKRGYYVIMPALGGSHFMNDEAKSTLDGIVAQVLKEHTIPANRVHAMGTSMGAGSSLAYAIHRPDLIRSVCAVMPMTDFKEWVKENPHYQDPVGKAYGGTYEEASEAYDKNSAILNADAFVNTPVMLIHGDIDTTVNYSQSKNLAEVLQQKGYRYEFYTAKDQAHKDKVMQDYQLNAADFFDSATTDASSTRKASLPPKIVSSWDDLTDGIENAEQWEDRQVMLRERYLDLLRDQYKPEKPELDLQIHETVIVENQYTRKLISYAVEKDERAYAYLGIPLNLTEKAPAVVALHGTYEKGKSRVAGLIENPDKAYLDHLCRRGYIVIAPEHFVSGHRTPAKGAYDTTEFYNKHPEWTAVGKFTYEHSIAIDVLQTLEEVDPKNIGALGHSLGGHGTFFLAAYDQRIKASASNCSASFFRHNAKADAWARDHWYVYFKHIRPEILNGNLPPIDFHEIISLIAPRAFLDLSGLNDGDPTTQRQRVIMLLKVMDVYELEGAPENFGFYVHGRKHSVAHESRELMYSWMDSHLKPAEATQTKLIVP